MASSLSVVVGCAPANDTRQRPGSEQKPQAPNQQVEPGGAPSTSPIRIDYKAGEVTALCTQTIERASKRIDAIASLSAEARNIDSALLSFEDTMADLNEESGPLTFVGYVSTDAALRDEGSKCEEALGQFYVGLFTRRDIYEAFRGNKARNAAEQRLLSETLQSFEDNGLKLSDEKLAELKGLLGEVSKKETAFSANLNNDVSTVSFTAEELAGVPAASLARFKRAEDGKLIVTTKSTDYSEVIENATNPETRRRIMAAYLNRGGEANTKLLEEATGLRARIAKLLGHETWADYKTASRMAQTKDAVLKFLNDLKGKLAERNRQDLAKLLAFKKELDPTATTLEQWDIGYYSYQLKKRDYTLDNEKIREYFPADVVVAGMFQVYSQLLGVTYVEVKDAKVWSSDVKLYEIRDTAKNERIGYFYADFFPREGKYGHAAAFTLVSGRIQADGKYNEPVSSIVANFTPPADGKPSLLTHDEVETIFHEFGHIMHQTLTRAPYASLSGSSTARDFVEAPSQMLENWVWSPEILPLISGHYQDNSKKLPADMLEKMLAARDFGQGIAYTKQLLYGLFDMTIHSASGQVDVTKIYDGLYREIVGGEPIAGGHFPGTFGHMMGGYDAGYYGYLWSEVYAQDMFSLFAERGLLNPEIGGAYRRAILEQGSMKESIDILKEFLGREPSPEAFFKKLNL